MMFTALVHRGRATYAFFERNWNLTRRYWAWEIVWLLYNIVNALSVTFIGAAAEQITGAKVKFDTNSLLLVLVIGTSVWSYLSVTFDGVTDIINMERWEGTIEYTFMAPISRFTHMVGSCLYAVAHGLLFTLIQLLVIAAFFHIDLSHANYLTALFLLLLGSISFIGFGIGAAILPLLYTEKGMQMSFIVKAVLLLVSGVYYPISVLPGWMQPLARISPATYVLEGLREAIMQGRPLWSPEIWSCTWPLILTGLISVPASVYAFSLAERYAKRTGKLKRNG
ncbi:MAG: ABC transporter permease [Thermogemmatispora sp.]|uniref:Transport permease protein n=2 Tax=Thermogemmatispora TaxID=768669 RepID=A0A328VK56_9CHLR|nr:MULTISPECIES: ABC transporter permease [Thermogemmatispora]MBE3564774.1 ABC transporter permease [Thermogemmatispora sp.]RAQ95494.1 ABC transporter [Thermogemmatispora tikiterensis]GER81878.1 ABC transporter [Thermogemmatispora aurantia]